MAADDLVEEIVTLRPGAEPLTVLRPRDAEALLTEEAFEREEYLPYWAELWPSGVALARRVAARPPRRGARVLELGCGLGLPSLVAARAGGRVLATDWSPDAIALLSQNAAHNEVDHLDLAPVAWDDPAAFTADGPWDLVLAADVLYERRNLPLLLGLLPRLEATAIWLTDPGDRSPRSSSKRHAPASSRTRGPTTSIRR
jgi:predicted nicotinamide N-methyase